MTYTIKTKKDELFVKYLMVINGTLKLSEKEIIILAEFMKYNEEYKNDPEIVFSAPIRKKIQATLKISPANLNNYIQYLKNKQMILEKGDALSINKNIIPQVINNSCSTNFVFIIEK